LKATIYEGDIRDTLSRMDDQTMQTAVTSPPYFGLRDYGMEGQIGLEPTVDAYVSELVAVFREVRRVLKDDGTLWLNLGDSYNAQPGQRKTTDKAGPKQVSNTASPGAPSRHVPEIKPKDLIGIPWRVAFALQADGWYLRKDNIWHKPNPMPESVTDRTTTSHEYMFHFSKSARYYYDAEAIAEPIADTSIARLSQANLENQNGSDRVPGKTNGNMKAVGPKFGGHKYGDSDDPHHNTKSGNVYVPTGKRNKRSVWTVATNKNSEAHFATFPPKLIEPCILAGSREGDTVFDPFTGSGTTAIVALRHGRNFVGGELNPEYVEMAKRRITNDAPMFNSVEVIRGEMVSDRR
jgi:DNA modification methylase